MPKSRVLEVSYSGSERANVVGFMRGLIRDRLRPGTHDLACEALLHSTSLLAHNIYNTHCRSDNFIMYKF